MGNRAAKFISTLVASIIAGAPLAAVSQNAPTATSAANPAADCLASPKGVAPQGQHWYYRLDRATKRQCWYLRAAGDKNSAKAAQTAQADTPAAEPTPQQHPPVQDARAEYLAPRNGAAAKTPSAVMQAAAAPAPQPTADQAPQSNAQQQPASPASPWPDVSTASPPPAPPPAPAVVAAAAQPAAKPAKSPSPVAPAAADTNPTDKPAGSVQKLLLVIGGALTLAGILGSLIYRFAGARVRVQSADRHGYWGDREAQDASRPPWRDAGPADLQPPRPIDFDAARPQATKQVTKLAEIRREIHLIEARKSRVAAAAAERETTTRREGEGKMFEGAFEIVAAVPKPAANESAEDRTAKDLAIKDRAVKHRTDAGDRTDVPADRDADAVDVDVITTMLEQLAKEGPRLSRPNLEADLANFARSLRGRSAARA
ncbi:hypothetical protein P0R31_20500 [Bradyrhizobium yuanmingense]|uniref:hypothetical protein n=1 Tax=Bradyrhizobium yuanmingense TaxID=108015 RepID=UPI0023B9BD9F|nr:hypothetical protein [Bradyrhizobium yuanmingense]MDF0519625.1 hypothetical protein [Bradyrhizobium yuanmingense]